MNDKNKIKPINPISQETLAKMIRKSMLNIPNNASEQGLSPEAIKRLSTDPLFNEKFSLYSEINRIVNEINGDGTDINPGIITELNKKLNILLYNDIVYTNDKHGEPSFIPYSIEPIENVETIPVRDKDGRLSIKNPTQPQHAVNKDYVDEAVLINKMPFTEVSKINYRTGYVTYKTNPEVVDFIDQSNLKKEGIIRVYYKIPQGCKYEEGGNK